MKDDIKLPPLPKGDIAADTCPVMWVHTDQQIESYATAAIKADRQQRGEPVAYAVFAENGNIRIWCADPIQAEALRQEYGERLQSLYTTPQPAAPAQDNWQLLSAHLYQAAGAFNMPVRFLEVLSSAANGEPFAYMLDGLLPVTANEDGVWDADSPPAQEPSLPEGWRIVERQTCYALHQGNEVIALLSGHRAEDNAALLAGLLARYGSKS